LTIPAPPLSLAETVLIRSADRQFRGVAMDGMTVVRFLPVLAFVAWCLWGIDWRKAWPVLAEGGWIPLVLIGAMAGFVWAFVFPTPAIVFGFIPMPNYLWQLEAVGLLICLALACGWLQTRLGWHPPEISFEPPPAAHDDHHHAH
jgi:hypothetical protein